MSVHAGDALPVFELPVTASVIVAGALASRDFMPVHHDKAYANQQGAPDIFMNILTVNGYVSRYITDWAGPNAVLKKIAIRLGVPVLPGHTLRFSGRVDSVAAELTTIAVEVTNELGTVVTGSVELAVLTV